MENPLSLPHCENTHIHSSGGSDLVDQSQFPSVTGPNTNLTTQGCSCVCSAGRYNCPTAWFTAEYQEPWYPGSTEVAYINPTVGGDNISDVGAIEKYQIHVPFDPLQPPENEVTCYMPARSLQTQTNARLNETRVFSTSVSEGLRPFAARYLHDPKTTVHGIHLEPGTSGRFRVVITLEITDIL